MKNNLKKCLMLLMLISIPTHATYTHEKHIELEELKTVNGGSIEFCKFTDDFNKHSFSIGLSKTNGVYEILMTGVIPRPYVETSFSITPEYRKALSLVKNNVGYSYSNTIKIDDTKLMYGVLGMNDIILFASDNLAVNYNVSIEYSDVNKVISCIDEITNAIEKLEKN